MPTATLPSWRTPLDSYRAEVACLVQPAFCGKGGSMKSAWVTPTLVGKPVSQTLSGLGGNQDGRQGEFQS